eukprot:3641878-Alexandrium_andersonii.AAC.1
MVRGPPPDGKGGRVGKSRMHGSTCYSRFLTAWVQTVRTSTIHIEPQQRSLTATQRHVSHIRG